MDKKQRDEIRERCKNVLTKLLFRRVDNVDWVKNMGDTVSELFGLVEIIPALLDALETTDNEAQSWANQYEEEQQKRYRVEEERDLYKDRCEALERALGKSCATCYHKNNPMAATKDICVECNKRPNRYVHWEFDQERFEKEDS